MGQTTAIEWTHRKHPITGQMEPGATVNFWIGCTKISDECTGCYAQAEDNVRSWTPNGWGKGKARYKVKGAEAAARALDRKARRLGMRLACFTNSLADMFDREVPEDWRDAAFEIMEQCAAVDFMVLTKRAEEMRTYIDIRYGVQGPPENIWLGVSCGRAEYLSRVAALLETPCNGRRFVSAEPLLEFVDFGPYVIANGLASVHARYGKPKGKTPAHLTPPYPIGIDLLIVGGESEHRGNPAFKARAMDPAWVRFCRDICWKTGTPFFFKQWGEWGPVEDLKHNPQAEAMVRLGNYPGVHQFNDAGPVGNWPRDRRVYLLGKRVTGNTLDGKHHVQLPPARDLEPEDLL